MLRYSVTSKVIDFNVGAVPNEEYKEIGRDLAESEKAIKILEEAGYDAFNADNGTYDSWYWAHPPVYMPLNCNLNEAEHIKKFTGKPVICAGRMQADKAEEDITNGKIDGFGIARQLLCDAEYLTKLKEGREEDVRPCISCHNKCLPAAHYKGEGVVLDLKGYQAGTCALNPVTMNEKKYQITKAPTSKKIAIVGGGIAGMETARICAMRGYEVTIFEKSDRLGGVFVAAAAPSFKEKDKELLKWYEHEIEKNKVRVNFNTEVRNIDALAGYDEIVIATGAKARKLPLNGFDLTIEATDYLLGNEDTGDTVAVIGGGLTGCEIAYDLALKGKHPFIIEMMDDVVKVKGVCAANSNMLRDLIRYHKIPAYLESSLKEVRENSVIIETKEGLKEIPCDSVIASVGYTASQSLVEKPSKHIHVLGDCETVGNLKTVIWGAYELAFSL